MKNSSRASSMGPRDAVTDEELGGSHRDYDDGLDQLHHRERDLVEHLERLARYVEHRHQKPDDHHDDRIIARQKRDQDAGKHVAVEEGLRQATFLTSYVDESGKPCGSPRGGDE